jgi:hypothetical protein
LTTSFAGGRHRTAKHDTARSSFDLGTATFGFADTDPAVFLNFP